MPGETLPISAAPVITPKTVFGLRTDIKSNAHYISEDIVLYPAGSNVTVHDFSTKKQKFIKVSDTTKIVKEVVIAPNRRWLALSEISRTTGELPTVTVYDLQTYKRRRCLDVQKLEEFPEPKSIEFSCMQFTFDSKYLMVVTGAPDWRLYQYHWDKNRIESSAVAKPEDNEDGTIDSIQCNPADATLVVVSGRHTFRIMNVQEAVWNQWGWSNPDKIIITTSMWLNPDRILFGTIDQKIMLVENGEVRTNCTFDARKSDGLAIKKTDADIPEEDTDAVEDEVEEDGDEKYPVYNLVNFSKGFVYCCGPGYVYMFEKESPLFYQRRNIYRLCRLSYQSTREHPMWSEMDEILHLTVSPAELTMLVTCRRSQLFTAKLMGPKMDEVSEIAFAELGPSMHYGRINALAMCAWKPLFITAGEDRSIRVWNYLKEDVEMVKMFQEEVHCISLHPTGLFALIGFSDKLRFMAILIDDFTVMREFPLRNCKLVKFSTNGHLFAAVHGLVIQIFCTVSFQNIYNLKGHNGRITGISWSANDLILVSCGAEGAVYEWSLSSGQRVGEIIDKTSKFNGCTVNSSGNVTYAAGSDGEVKRIADNTMQKSFKLMDDSLDLIILSRSDIMLFVTGGEGWIKSLQFGEKQQHFSNEFHVHHKKVTALALSYDDITLVSVAEDASIVIWQLANPEARAIQLDVDFAYTKEILISRKDLQEKMNNIELLSTRMSELETEHSYQLRQSEASHSEKLKELHDGYCATIQGLKDKNEAMENEHNHEIGCIQQDIAKLKASHERTLQEMEAEFNIRLINEYNRYQNLETKATRMRDDYEKRIEALEESKREAMRELYFLYEAKLEDKDVALSELQEEADLEKREHEAITTSIENDADKEILDIKEAYIGQLETEKNSNVRLKGEIGLMKKKLITARKETEELKHTISQLKAEHKQFQKVISGLEKEVLDIKKDIGERDQVIKDKEKRISHLFKKRGELEKYKFVLNFRITELKNQIEPLEMKIKDSKQRTLELEEILEDLLKIKAHREEKIKHLLQKINDEKMVFSKESEKCSFLLHSLKQIKIDFHDMTGSFQDPVQLKKKVKELFQKYIEDPDFLHNRETELEAIMEFHRQRQFLQQEIEKHKRQLEKELERSKCDISKIMDENCALLEEINGLRHELKATRARCFQLQSALGLTARYVPPSDADAILDFACEDRDHLLDKYRDQFIKKHEIIVGLKEEKARLQTKIEPPRSMPPWRLPVAGSSQQDTIAEIPSQTSSGAGDTHTQYSSKSSNLE